MGYTRCKLLVRKESSLMPMVYENLTEENKIEQQTIMGQETNQ